MKSTKNLLEAVTFHETVAMNFFIYFFYTSGTFEQASEEKQYFIEISSINEKLQHGMSRGGNDAGSGDICYWRK